MICLRCLCNRRSALVLPTVGPIQSLASPYVIRVAANRALNVSDHLRALRRFVSASGDRIYAHSCTFGSQLRYLNLSTVASAARHSSSVGRESRVSQTLTLAVYAVVTLSDSCPQCILRNQRPNTLGRSALICPIDLHRLILLVPLRWCIIILIAELVTYRRCVIDRSVSSYVVRV